MSTLQAGRYLNNSLHAASTCEKWALAVYRLGLLSPFLRGLLRRDVRFDGMAAEAASQLLRARRGQGSRGRVIHSWQLSGNCPSSNQSDLNNTVLS